jgi:GT2 family glycosyltransferase
MKNKKISIVMLNYNGLKYLKKTIPEILKIKYENHEFIIVDNGSTDGSIEFIKKFREIKLIENKKNLGYSMGKNIGVRKSTGEIILLIDNDIMIKDKNILNKISKKLNKNTILTFMLEYNGKKNTNSYGGYFNIYGINSNKEIEIKKLKREEEYPCSFPHGEIMTFYKAFWNNTFHGYDERQPYMLDDNDLGMRAWIMGYNCKTLTNSRIINLGEKNNETNEYFYWKYKFYFSGLGTSIIKNCNIKSIVILFPVFTAFCIAKSIKQTIKRRSLLPLLAMLKSTTIFIKNIKTTLGLRKKIQKQRKIKNDLFLQIRPPKIR